MCCVFVGMNINEEIQRSEQHLPSVSSETFSESCSTHTSKVNDEKKAFASNRNKEYLGEIGGETKTNNLTNVLGYYYKPVANLRLQYHIILTASKYIPYWVEL